MVGGEGVKIGVISDGVDNLSNVQQNSELSNVTVLNPGYGNEGTAMLEIVHDLAPNAFLYFYGGMLSYIDFAQGIISLKAQGCKIIVDDIGFFNEPYFTDEDTCIGKAIREFLFDGGVFVSAAGNDNYSVDNYRGYSIYSGITNVGFDNINVFHNLD